MHLIPVVHDWFLSQGLPVWIKAAFYGFVSSVALPLGALFGISLAPTAHCCAYIVAFGAGALIFAVTTELYAEALRETELDGRQEAIVEIGVSMLCAVVGAVLFTLLNLRLAKWSMGEPEAPRSGEGSPLLRRRHLGLTESFRVEVKTAPDPPLQNVALAMWLGIAVDSIPESVLIGFITNEKAMTVAFLSSIFVANFPEALSSSSMLKDSGMKTWQIGSMWLSLCVLTTLLSGLASWWLPTDMHASSSATPRLVANAAEGLAAGAMLAMVCATMLPAAFKHGGLWTGPATVCGFLMSCSVKVFFGRAPGGNTMADKPLAPSIDVAAKAVEQQAARAAAEIISFLAKPR